MEDEEEIWKQIEFRRRKRRCGRSGAEEERVKEKEEEEVVWQKEIESEGE